MGDLLKNKFGVTKTDTNYEETVGSGETWTVIAITICNTEDDDDATFDLYVDTNGSGADAYIYKNQSLPADATFEHTSKIILTTGQKLGFVASANQDIDVFISYLEQT